MPGTAKATGSRTSRRSRPAATGDGDLVEVTGPNGAQPVYVARSWLTTTIEQATTTGKNAVQVALCHPTTGALLDDTATNTTSARGTHDVAATGPTQSPGPGDPPPVDDRGTGSGDTGASQRSAATVER